MDFIYTPHEVRKVLETDAQHGAMYAFVFKEFDKRGFSFTVERLGVFTAIKTTPRSVTIDTAASDLATAAKWARDGLRQWAGQGIDDGNIYFAEIARGWAVSQSASCTKCLGSTVDFLYLFSAATAEGDLIKIVHREHMYPISSSIKRDLKGILLWVFVTWWDVGVVQGLDAAPVKTDQTDLHPDYHDSGPGNFNDDQTHHFALYFYVGVKVGSFLPLLKPVLKRTHDIDENGNIINEGDYYLGRTAAELGDDFDDSPGFIGAKITETLKKPSRNKIFDYLRRSQFSARDPWINEDGRVAHPHSPVGKGGLGRFAAANPLPFEPDPGELPHSNSPSTRYLDPLQIYRYLPKIRLG